MACLAALAVLGASCKRNEMVPYDLAQKESETHAGPLTMKVETKSAPPSCEGERDRDLGTERATGLFAGVQIADGTRLLLRDEKGKLMNLRADDEALAHFVFTHKKERVHFEYQVLETCLPQAGGRIRIQRLTDARVESTAYREWKRDAVARQAAAQAFRAYVESVFGK
jgi:hypothetical protein